MVDAVLPSATDGYDFLFSATVWWQPTPEHPRPSEGASPAVAVSSVVSRAWRSYVTRSRAGRASRGTAWRASWASRLWTGAAASKHSQPM